MFELNSMIKNTPEKPIIQVSCGYHSVLMLTEDGKVYVMGLNTYGQLGLGSRLPSPTPTYLQSLQGMPIMQVASGAYHSIVLTVSGNIFAFGRNESVQLLKK
jgi:alpha-tubulin suppressor-like RCC1 family protein